MKIRLQDAVGTVHTAERSDMQYLITAAGVMTGTGTLLYKSTLVLCKEENFLPNPYRIIGLIYGTINFFYVRNN